MLVSSLRACIQYVHMYIHYHCPQTTIIQQPPKLPLQNFCPLSFPPSSFPISRLLLSPTVIKYYLSFTHASIEPRLPQTRLIPLHARPSKIIPPRPIHTLIRCRQIRIARNILAHRRPDAQVLESRIHRRVHRRSRRRPNRKRAPRLQRLRRRSVLDPRSQLPNRIDRYDAQAAATVSNARAEELAVEVRG